MGYVIGSFNLRDLNFANHAENGEKISRDFNKIAEIIRKEGFDVIAIQEANAELPIKHLTQILNRARNILTEWDYVYSGQAATTVNDPEGYAFIWNKKRLRLTNTLRNNNPCFYSYAGGTALLRPPYYARFTARKMFGGSNFELRLINVHIKDATSEVDRIKEFDVLVKQVMPRCVDHQSVSAEGEIMPAYTFLLGDYNLRLDKGPKSQIKIEGITSSSFTGKRRYYRTVQQELTSLRQAAEQQSIRECYANNYDHFTYECDLSEKLRMTESRVEALGKYYRSESGASNMLRAYREQISDHVPIRMEVELK